MQIIFGAEFRKVENREYLGKPSTVMIAVRSYDTTVDDLWQAITTPERLARWFSRVEGDLKPGGHYRIEGNASGTIAHCDPPEALDLTWEFDGTLSWVTVRIAADSGRAKLTLEHIAHLEGPGAEFHEQYGPGAGGVGWDLGLHGLARHLVDPGAALDHGAVEAWSQSTEGKDFIRASGEAWGIADAESGEDPKVARARAERTIAFYTGG
ncbi:MAG TPA: SRPBCC family protein [Xanthomonadaceae bacterium]|nr:SRPBCC family protein [Xanthomonadaceae bacterium]